MTKILVIEDEAPVRINILRLLKLEEFEGIGAENGSLGVQLAKEQAPDLIICDIMMPELDGYGVLAALRQNPATATIPFIFLSAKAAKDDLRQGMEMGANDYLNKPFTRAELLKVIKVQLEKQENFHKKAEEKLAQLRNNLTLSLPHELRTPLNGILGLSEMMTLEADSISPDEIRDIAESIYSSAQRLDELIHKFLLYAEIEIIANDLAKIKAFRNQYTDFSVTLITEVCRQKAKEKSREVDLVLDLIESPVKVLASDLEKIVKELVDNAFKYSPAQTSVQIKNTLSNQTFILEIINQGRGMTSEQISNLGAYMQFERKRYAQEGPGLGLIIAKRLAEIYGGELQILSVPNEETTVRVSLPL